MATQENKEIARRYHDLKPEDVDELLTPDYVGRSRSKPGGGYLATWGREDHRKFLRARVGTLRDSIHQQVAEGDWVATWFTRDGHWTGKNAHVDVMHFKRFRDGKIAELWEYADWAQLQEEVKA